MPMLSRAFYPIAVISSFCVLTAGIYTPVNLYGIGIGLIITVAMMVIVLERRRTFDINWLLTQSELGLDIALAFMGLILIQVVIAASRLLAADASLPTLWPVMMAPALQIILFLFIADFLGYWLHRLMHTSKLLWRWHHTHHNAVRLYWFNVYRLHPADSLLSAIVGFAWAPLIGVPDNVVWCANILFTVHLLIQHSNINLHNPRLAPLLATAEFHRWHHHPSMSIGQSNYGHFLGIWDWLFGSYTPGTPMAPYRVGVDETTKRDS